MFEKQFSLSLFEFRTKIAGSKIKRKYRKYRKRKNHALFSSFISLCRNYWTNIVCMGFQYVY